MKTFYLALTAIVLLFSCSSTPDNKPNAQAPDALDGDSEISIKRSGGNMIDDLYTEALGSNEKLKALDDQIATAYKLAKESPEAAEKFMADNSNFYVAASRYAEQIADTALRQRMSGLIRNSEANFASKSKNITSTFSALQLSEKKLNNYYAALKLYTAYDVMLAYQKNGTPDIAEMKNAIAALNKAVQQAETVISK